MRKGNVFGLIGYPLGHSFSKIYFEEKFEEESLKNLSFKLFPIESINLFPNLLQKCPNIAGLAVTIPHKQAVMQYLDEVSIEARKVGAVNCIQFKNGQTIGHNTDVKGFEESLLPLIAKPIPSALVLGTGGASKAVQYVLGKNHMPFKVVSRCKANGDLTYEDIDEGLMQENKLIINCTPVGMMPNVEECPNMPYHLLTPNHLLYDLIYKPAETLFLSKGKNMGASTKNGFEMLIIQAEENWRIWNS